LRIGIDARWIFEKLSGIGIYTRELIRNLAAIDRDNEYVLIFDDPGLMKRTMAELGEKPPNFHERLVPWTIFSLRNQFFMPRFIRETRLDVYHSTNYMIPLPAFPRWRTGRDGPKCVTTIHDLIPFVVPDHAPRSKKSLLFPAYRQLMYQVGRRSDAIITVSERSRKDVIEHLRLPPAYRKKVQAIPNGVSSKFQPSASLGQARNPEEQAARKLLYVGRTDPYKNVSTLIRVLAQLRRNLDFPIRLQLASSPDPRYPEPVRLIAELGLENSVNWLGYLSDDELLHVYQDADVLVHPSEYEGFGLQIIEAMACGLPVVCSNGGSLEEIADGAALTMAPHDEKGFARAVTDLLTSTTMAEDLRKKGLARASEFKWQRTARETLEVYESINSAEAAVAPGAGSTDAKPKKRRAWT
jgi:glycosyltransferase involved in cell wall biosynthesis